MNKLIIVMLFVGLVTMHGFAKRYVPTNSDHKAMIYAEQILRFAKEISKQIDENVSEKELEETVNQAVEQLKQMAKRFWPKKTEYTALINH